MLENTDTSQRTRLGNCLATGADVFISQSEMTQALHIMGENGTGKTNLLLQMILDDIHAGLPIELIEPHGDLTNAVLANIPRERLKDVIYLDIEDYSAPFGINVFATVRPGNIKTRAASASFISHIFERIWEYGT